MDKCIKCGKEASILISFTDDTKECAQCYIEWMTKAQEVNREAQNRERLAAERREERKQQRTKKGSKHGSEQVDSNW